MVRYLHRGYAHGSIPVRKHVGHHGLVHLRGHRHRNHAADVHREARVGVLCGNFDDI